MNTHTHAPLLVQRPPGGYRITVYHSLHGEVDAYRTHWWKCDRCDNVIKRAMNRPPQVCAALLHA